jgi:hypothetical protein
MATPNKINPQAVIEDLDRIPSPRGGQGAAGVSTFVGASPTKVSADKFAGSGFTRVIQGLAQLEPALTGALENHLDRQIAEDKAAAELFKVKNPEETKNMEAFKQACLTNPELLNASPYVKRYIEHEVIKGNALQFAAQLDDAYTTSGIANERDPKKVQLWAEEQRKNFMKANGLDGYDDQLALAQNFAHPSMRMVEHTLARHTKNMESQNAALLEQQMFANVDAFLVAQQNIGTNGQDLKIPAERRAYVSQVAAPLIMQKAEELKALGYTQDKILPLLGKMVLGGRHSPQVAKQLAEAITVDVNGQRVSLMSQPNIAKGIEQMQEAENDKSWKATARAHQVQAWQREDNSRNALKNAVTYGADPNNTDFSKAKIVDELHLCSEADYLAFKQAAQNSAQGNFKSLYTTPESATAALELESRLRRAVAGRAEVMALAQQGYSPAEVSRLLGIADSTTTDEGKSVLAAQKEIAKTYLASVGQMTMQDAADLYDDYTNGRSNSSTKPSQEVFVDVLQQLPDVEAGFSYFIDEQRKEKAQKDGEDTPFTSMEIQSLKQQYLAEKLKNENTALKAQAQERLTKRNEAAELQSYLKKNTEGISPTWSQDSVGGVVTERDMYSPAGKAISNSLTALNTLFAGASEVPELAQVNSLADLITKADGMTPKGLSWQEAFFIATGGLTPEKAGITSAEEAKAYLPAHFEKQYGIQIQKATNAPQRLKRNAVAKEEEGKE